MQKIDKNILIFGGSGLIGSTIYNFLKRENTNLVCADIKNTIKDKHNFIKCDILNSKEIIKAKNFFLKKYKSIDAIINCTYPRSRKFNQNFEVLKKKDLINDLNSHLGTYFEINKIFCNYFKKKNNGNIINFNSIYGDFLPRFEIYKNSKFSMPIQYLISKNGILQISKYMAKYYLKNNIKINCISPGGIFDNHKKSFVKMYGKYTSSNKMLNKHDLCEAVKFLLNKNAKITGQNIIVDEGFTL